jgi:hypothetical protein
MAWKKILGLDYMNIYLLSVSGPEATDVRWMTPWPHGRIFHTSAQFLSCHSSIHPPQRQCLFIYTFTSKTKKAHREEAPFFSFLKTTEWNISYTSRTNTQILWEVFRLPPNAHQFGCRRFALHKFLNINLNTGNVCTQGTGCIHART